MVWAVVWGRAERQAAGGWRSHQQPAVRTLVVWQGNAECLHACWVCSDRAYLQRVASSSLMLKLALVLKGERT
jgi:hypothetical protein